jgi:PPOX class probable F420-dependent enzyme
VEGSANPTECAPRPRGVLARTLPARALYRGAVIEQLSRAALELLGSAAVATVATLNDDGPPHLSSAWVGVEHGEIVFGTLDDQRKLRNLRRDPRIALTVQSDRINAWGLREYLVIDGTARVTEGGAPELLQRLARIYIGPDAVFPAMPDPPPGFVTRVRIGRISGIGPWRR